MERSPGLSNNRAAAPAIASNGVMNIFGTFNGGQATYTSNSSGQFGTMKAVSGGTLKVNGNIAKR